MKVSASLQASALALGVLACGRTELEFLGSETWDAPEAGDVDSGGAEAGDADSNGPDESCQWGFATPAKYEVAGYPVDVVVGDFDGDHANDVLTVNSESGQIALLSNLGRGELTLRGDGRVGTRPFVFASADFSGDGSLDLAVAYLSQDGSGTSSVSIYLNRGDGTFTSEVAYQNPAGAFGIVAGDFDGDYRADLAIASGGMTAYLLMNDGDGTFRFGPVLPTGYASHLTAADFDHDGALDLGVAGSFAIAVLTNLGSGEFGSPVVYDNSPACDYVGPLIAGDLNGDDYPDLVRTCYQGGAFVAVRTNTGDGNLSDEVTYPTGQWPHHLVMGDFTGHGHNDLAVANSWAYANSVSVLPNLGDGTFAPKIDLEAGAPVAIAAGDLNGDGHLDLATAGNPGYPADPAAIGTVSVLLSICE